jgi:hypothetical protein
MQLESLIIRPASLLTDDVCLARMSDERPEAREIKRRK